MSRISAVQVYRADLPLSLNLEHASASTAQLEEVFLRVCTASGGWGLAEARGNGSYATGTDTTALLNDLVEGAAQAMLGRGFLEAREAICEVYTAPLARAVADVAVLDAMARADRVPLWSILGGRNAGLIPTHAQIGFWPMDTIVKRARTVTKTGFRRIKVRVGRPDPQADIAVIHTVRNEVGNGIALSIDANGGWNAEEAIRILGAVESSGISWVEQPTPPGDDDALRAVRQGTSIPIVGDESIMRPDDIARLCDAEAIDGVHLKLEKAGSTAALARMAAEARAAGLDVYIGQMDQGRLGSCVTAHIAASIEAVAYELWGFQEVARDVATGLEVRDGGIALPLGPGTGVDVDLNKLELVKEIS